MTYCVAMALDAGMIFASDSRTNAGVDHIARFSKMRVFKRDGERMIVTLSSGNLSITQNALSMIEQRNRSGDSQLNFFNAESMFDVARLLGDSLREVKSRDGAYLMQNNIDSSANFIIGGQVRGEPARLFHVYSEGNFIEATPDTPYFQIGETKYGKPIIDRVIKRTTTLAEAIKCVLVSFDSTMRSNISVGLPIDLLVYETDSLRAKVQKRIDDSDPYFQMLHTQWGEGLRRVFGQLPDPNWVDEKGVRGIGG
jgi:putative proteasome-type protease